MPMPCDSIFLVGHLTQEAHSGATEVSEHYDQAARHPAPLHHLARHKQAAGGSFDVDRGPFDVDQHQPEESCIGLSLQTCTLNLV